MSMVSYVRAFLVVHSSGGGFVSRTSDAGVIVLNHLSTSSLRFIVGSYLVPASR